MYLIDTHAHLYDITFDAGDSLASLIERCRTEGVQQVYMPNINLESLPRMLAVEKEYPDFCRSMIGLHPCDVTDDYRARLSEMEPWLAKHRFAAVGEIGLDLYHSRTHRKEQEEAFRIQIGWARTHDIPVVIHCRDAFKELLSLLETLQDGQLRGVVHCFTGSYEDAQRVIDLGLHLGIGGILTYKNAGLAEIVEKLPLEHMVLETDSPYLAPAPKRGKQNEPSYLPYIAGKLAEIHGVTPEEVAAITTEQARALFENK